MNRGALILSLPIPKYHTLHELPNLPPKNMYRYPLRHSTYFTNTDHTWTSELPVSTLRLGSIG